MAPEKNIKNISGQTLIPDKVELELDSGCGGGSQPCNPGGGSPSLHTAITRITGPLFTGRDCLPVCNCGMTSLKSISTQVGVPRRVERPSLKICTKGNLPLPQPDFLTAFLFNSRFVSKSNNSVFEGSWVISISARHAHGQ